MHADVKCECFESSNVANEPISTLRDGFSCIFLYAWTWGLFLMQGLGDWGFSLIVVVCCHKHKIVVSYSAKRLEHNNLIFLDDLSRDSWGLYVLVVVCSRF